MTDVPRLLDACASGALQRPAAERPNTVDAALAVASACGVDDLALSPNARRIADAVGAQEHLVFILVDGLGMSLIERQPAGFLAAHVAEVLQSTFPSSTAPALTSIATGLWPAQHAVPGWYVYLPDARLTATILPFIDRYTKEDARTRGIASHVALPAPVLAARIPRRQFRVMPARIHNSVYSRYASGGADGEGYRSLRAAFDAAAAHVELARAPTYTYLYTSVVDTAGHQHGADAKQTRRAFRVVQDRVDALAERLRGRARIVLTADHGQIDLAPEQQTHLPPGDPMFEHLLVPPTCEPRVAAFHVRDGHEAAFEQHFRDRFGERFVLLTTDEADDLRLFGPDPLAPETRRRLGQYVAIALEAAAILHLIEHPMVGFHGGMHPDEMRVPLVIA